MFTTRLVVNEKSWNGGIMSKYVTEKYYTIEERIEALLRPAVRLSNKTKLRQWTLSFTTQN
jgi:hypothetical protein